jgi:hypothetical protein
MSPLYPPPNIDSCADRATGPLPRERFSPVALPGIAGDATVMAGIGSGNRTLATSAGLARAGGRGNARQHRRSLQSLCLPSKGRACSARKSIHPPPTNGD